MKRVLCLVLTAAMFLTMGTFAYADSSETVRTETVYYPNGYYSVTEIHTFAARANELVSGYKLQSIYNTYHEVIITFQVNGTFKYNGTTCVATLASYDYDIIADGWRFVSGNAYCDSNVAVAEGEFKHPLLGTVETTVALACSPTGVLS